MKMYLNGRKLRHDILVSTMSVIRYYCSDMGPGGVVVSFALCLETLDRGTT